MSPLSASAQACRKSAESVNTVRSVVVGLAVVGAADGLACRAHAATAPAAIAMRIRDHQVRIDRVDTLPPVFVRRHPRLTPAVASIPGTDSTALSALRSIR